MRRGFSNPQLQSCDHNGIRHSPWQVVMDIAERQRHWMLGLEQYCPC